MYTKLIVASFLLTVCKELHCEETEEKPRNDVVNEEEKLDYEKRRYDLKHAVPMLGPLELKCYAWHNRYCTEETLELKRILIKAVKDDCYQCTVPEREGVGRVVTSLLAHHPVTWKHILTEHGAFKRVQQSENSSESEKNA